jgi:PAS domain S-box-containing protein
MQPRIKLLEKTSITQRQALLSILALYFLGALSLILLKFTAPKHHADLLFFVGLLAALVFGGAWFLYYRYNWESIRYFAAITTTLLVALYLPEPYVSSYAPMVILIPIILSLVVAGTLSVVMNSVLMIAILLVRAGGSGVYAHPITLILYAMLVGGLLVKRLIDISSLAQLRQAQETVKQGNSQMQALVASLDDIVIQFDELGTYLNVWTADESLLSHPKNQLLGGRIRDALGEEVGRPFEDAIRRVAESGQPESMEYSLDVIGGRHWFSARLNFIPDPGGCSTVSMLIRDISERKQMEQAYAASQKRFQALIEHAPDGIALLDQSGILRQVTSSAKNILGYGPDEATGLDPAVLTHPEDQPALLALLQDLMQVPGGVARMEYRFRHQDGSWRWLDSTVSNLLAEPGVQAIVFNYRDVTERKQAEADLQASEARYRLLFEENPLPLLVYDTGSLHLLAVNDAAVAQYGYERDEFLQMTIREIRPPDEMPRLESLLNRPRPHRERSGPWKQRKKDGRLFDAEVVSSETGFLGRPARLVLINDITEQLQTRAALATSELRFRSLIENSADGITVVSYQGTVTYVSPSIERLLGYTPEEAIGRQAMDFVHRQDRVRLLEHVARLHRAGSGQEVLQYRFKHKDGSWRWLESTLAHQVDARTGQGIVFNYRDVTERKQAERELETVYGQMQILFDNLDDVFFSIDTVHWKILQLSPACERMYGRPVSAFLEDPQLWNQVVHPDDRHIIGENYPSLSSGESLQHVYRIQRPDGEVRWVEAKLKPTLDPQGTLLRMDGIVADITGRKQAEAKLQASEARYRLATRATNDVIWEWNAVTDRLTWAENAQIVFGYSPAELADTGWWDSHIHPEDRQRVTSGLRKLLDGSETVWSDEYHFLLKQGSYAIFSDRGYVERDETGKAIRMIGAISDITQRRQAEEHIKYQASLLENVSEAIIGTDMTGRITSWNTAAEKIYGWRAEEALGLSVDDLLQTEFQEQSTTEEQLQQLLEQGVWRSEVIQKRQDGTRIAILSAVSVVHDRFNRSIAMVADNSDITARKQAEESLANSERRFRALIENGLDYISLLNAEGMLLWESPSNTRMLKYMPDEMLGRNIFALVHPDDLGVLQHQFAELCREPGGQKASVFRIQNANGTWLWVEAVATNLLQVPSVGAIVLNYRDITERKLAEDELHLLNLELENRVAERTLELNHTNAELEHASRAKDEFLANMSHELRTPLNSILGLSESLLEQRRGALNEHQQRSLQVIEASGVHLLGLINDILDVSKIEAGKFDFYPETILVDDLVQSSLAFVKSQSLKKSIRLSYERDPQVSRIQADPRRLKQILVNLLTNAVKFTPEGGQVILQVRANAGENLIQFSVIDTGIGIAAKDLARLFRPFEQVDSQLNRQYDGSGLGLALVQKLTDLHGGSVHVESEVGQGSCFTINLPWVAERELPAGGNAGLRQSIPSQEPSRDPEKSIAPITILLAEDHVTNILTIGEYLEGRGYRVVVAHDGAEALEKAQESDPDLILMDIQMPVIDGLQATSRLRAQARFVHTPIIALTALAMPGDRERCILAGANEYMSKPVSLSSLVQTIQQLLEQYPREKWIGA